MKVTWILLIVLLFWENGYSQYNEDWRPAEIYLNDGAVLKGQARVTMLDKATPFGQKERLRFTEGRKKPVKEIKAKLVDSIIFNIEYRENKSKVVKTRKVKFIVIPKNDKKTKLGFAQLIIDGKVRLLKRTVSNGNGFSVNVFDETLIQKNNTVPVEFNYAEIKSFKKRAMLYFQECPSLVGKIENNDFNKKDLESIVRYYNDNCAK